MARSLLGLVDDSRRITRLQVFQLADAELSEDNAEALFCASLAWGLGTKARQLPTRLNAYAANREGARHKLLGAWRAVRSGEPVAECYAHLLCSRGQTRIPHLGAAFATKYLYFSTGTTEAPRCLILDAVVARSLRACGVWPGAPTHRWWQSTYVAYCDLFRRWAEEATSQSDDSIRPDQIEMAAFSIERGRGEATHLWSHV